MHDAVVFIRADASDDRLQFACDQLVACVRDVFVGVSVMREVVVAQRCAPLVHVEADEHVLHAVVRHQPPKIDFLRAVLRLDGIIHPRAVDERFRFVEIF